MDAYKPAVDMKCIDTYSELLDFKIRDVVDINSVPPEILGTLGCLGLSRA